MALDASMVGRTRDQSAQPIGQPSVLPEPDTGVCLFAFALAFAFASTFLGRASADGTPEEWANKRFPVAGEQRSAAASVQRRVRYHTLAPSLTLPSPCELEPVLALALALDLGGQSTQS